MSTRPADLRSTTAPDAFTSFGTLLLYLRRRARLRQRDLAIAVGYSEAQIGRLENNQRLPDVATVMAHFIPALDLNDAPALAQRLIELARAAHGDAIDPSPEIAPPVVQPQPSTPIDLDLPQSTAPLIGRDAELARLDRMLEDGQHRCITLLGPGGVGKTRLATEAARRWGPRFADGVHVLSLAGLPTPDLLAPALLHALGLSAPRDSNIVGHLRAVVRSQHALLLLDNMEHLVEAADLVGSLLVAAPDLWVLTTSRERLRIRDEIAVEIGGLPLPEPSDATDTLLAGSAVQLFIAAAKRVRPGSAWTPHEIAAIARICALVDGLPLGIELATSWLHLLACDEIEAELRQSLDFLHTAQRDLPQRHRSLRAVFDHSWRLLAPPEQHALARLSVFGGSFTREAAHAVLHPGSTASAARATLPLLGALVDKSLLKRVETTSGSRFVLHELVRQYAAERGREQPDHDRAARDDHSRYFLDLLHAHETAIRGPAQHHALDLLAAENDNLHVALRHAASMGDVVALRRVLPALCVLIEWRNTIAEGVALLRDGVIAPLRSQQSSDPDQATHRDVLALALAYLGWFQFYFGRVDDALAALDEAHALIVDSRDCLVRGDVLLFRGFVTGDTGDLPRGKGMLIDSVRAYEACGDEWRIARGLYRLATLLHAEGASITARHLFADCLLRLRVVGDPRATAFTLNRIAMIDAVLGRLDDAQDALQESLGHTTAIHDARGTAMALYYIGGLAQQRDDHAAARYFFHESLQIFRELHEEPSIADALAQLGYSAAVAGDHPAARRYLDDARRTTREGEISGTSIAIVVGRAALDLADTEIERAVEALTAALDHPLSRQESRDRAAGLLRQAESRLTPYQFAAAQARGRGGSPHLYLAD